MKKIETQSRKELNVFCKGFGSKLLIYIYISIDFNVVFSTLIDKKALVMYDNLLLHYDLEYISQATFNTVITIGEPNFKSQACIFEFFI